MMRPDVITHQPGGIKVMPKQMPNSLQVGEMPNAEPEIISSENIPSDKTITQSTKSRLPPLLGSNVVVPFSAVEQVVPSTSVIVIDSNGATATEVDSNDEENDDQEDNDTEISIPNGSVLDRRLSASIKSKSLADVPVAAAKARTRKLTAYEQVSQELSNDKRTLKEITLGRRVGFYRIRTELGSGNFSQVKMAVHALTRGMVRYDAI